MSNERDIPIPTGCDVDGATPSGSDPLEASELAITKLKLRVAKAMRAKDKAFSVEQDTQTLQKPGGQIPSGDQPTLTTLQQFEMHERLIEENLQTLERNEAQIAIAEHLFAIDIKRLFKAAGFRSLRAYVKTRFPNRKKSRLYQLLAFGRARHQAMESGKPVPINERQFRRTSTRIPDNADPFAQFWHPVFKYLNKKFRACPAPERRRFVEMVEFQNQSFKGRLGVVPNGDNHSLPIATNCGEEALAQERTPDSPRPATQPQPGVTAQVDGMTIEEARERGYVR